MICLKDLCNKIRRSEYYDHLVEDVFILVSYIWESCKDHKDGLKLIQNGGIEYMFEMLGDAIEKAIRTD